MKTKREISTISYNTIDFLVMELEQLIQDHVISFWCVISHQPDEDEKKPHHHVYIIPNGQLDTMDLQLQFREYDPNKPDKPLGCINFEYSKRDDWILYGEHYEPYLASKFQSRKHHYTKEHFISSDEDTFDYYYNHAFTASDWAVKNQILLHLTSCDMSPTDLIEKGVVPLNQASQLNAYLYMKTHYGTERNGHANHEDNEWCEEIQEKLERIYNNENSGLERENEEEEV